MQDLTPLRSAERCATACRRDVCVGDGAYDSVWLKYSEIRAWPLL